MMTWSLLRIYYIAFSKAKKPAITAYPSMSGNLYFEKRTKYG